MTSTLPAPIKTKSYSTVATYATHTSAEAAIKELQKAGFDMKMLSIVGRNYQTEEHVVGYYDTGNRVKYWGKAGAFWGGIWGWVFGSAFFFIPGVGPLVIAGPLASWLVGALEGAVLGGGLSAIGACMYSQGIPKDSVLQYETALKNDKFLLIIHGSMEDAGSARDILSQTKPESLENHQ